MKKPKKTARKTTIQHDMREKLTYNKAFCRFPAALIALNWKRTRLQHLLQVKSAGCIHQIIHSQPFPPHLSDGGKNGCKGLVGYFPTSFFFFLFRCIWSLLPMECESPNANLTPVASMSVRVSLCSDSLYMPRWFWRNQDDGAPMWTLWCKEASQWDFCCITIKTNPCVIFSS